MDVGAQSTLLKWYGLLDSRRVDLVGDYAGRELFFLEGDSLLLECFSDPKIDFQDGFQLLHAVYAVEQFLGGLIQRKCNFHIVFLDSHGPLCVPSDATAENTTKYLLAREVIIRHLRTNLPSSHSDIKILLFHSLQDPSFGKYLRTSAPYFMMCHDGASSSTDLSTNNSGPEDPDSQSAGDLQKSIFRVMVQDAMKQGLNVALINGLEWRDTKIFAVILEGTRRSKQSLEDWDPQFNSMKKELASIEESQNGRSSDDNRGIQSVDLGQQLDRLLALKEQSRYPFTEKTLLTIITLTQMLRDDEAKVPLANAFLLHTLLIDELSLSNRRFEAVGPSSADSRSTEGNFLLEFAERATKILQRSEWKDTMSTLSVKCDIIDLVDGKTFYLLSCASEEGFIGRLPPPLREKYNVLLDCVLGSDHYVEKSSDLNGNVQKQPQSKTTSSPARHIQPMLTFSNPVFDHHLASINISLGVVDDNLGRPNRIFQELTHWHNAKRLLDPKKRPAMNAAQTEWAKKRLLRRNQNFMAEMKAYAASLTNSTGNILEPTVMMVSDTKGKPESPAVAETKQHQSKKKDTKSKTSSTRRTIEVEQAAKKGKEIEKLFAAWQSKRELLDGDGNLERRYQATRSYLASLPRAKQEILGTEIRLYLVQVLLQLWTRVCIAGKKQSSYGLAALIWDSVQNLANSEKGLTKAIVQTLETVSRALRIPFSVSNAPLDDRPLSFNFQLSSQSELLSTSLPPSEFQLLHCGPYFDRSVDSAPDSRVPFQPDGWQRKVLDEIDANRSVFVVAPTSAGKTFISFYAMEKILRADNDSVLVYVAPTKALVNQIAAEIEGRFSKSYKHGGKSVWAIHTRDYRINNPSSCQILVTVPHILQIMLLAPSNAKSWSTRVKRIIFDEIHSIGQADDGVVWEQLLLLAPCPIIALSATVGNPEEFSSWLNSSQESLGTQLSMVKYGQRYSDLRKFVYVPPKKFAFKGLPPKSGFAQLGLDGSSSFAFVHPVTSLTHKSRGIPDDLTLEARDCFTLWQALRKHQTEDFPLDDALDPVQILPTIPKRADIFKWQKGLMEVVHLWMRDDSSPFDKVMEELGQTLNDRSAPETQVADPQAGNMNGKESGDDNIEFKNVDTADLCATTLPLLARLQEQDALPAILFNYDRLGCESICLAVFNQLKEAEDRYKSTSPQWTSRIKTWEQWKLEQLKSAKAPKKAVKSSKSGNKDDSVSKSEMERDAANVESSAWATFDPEAPLEEFSFADKKKSNKEELAKYVRELLWRGVDPLLVEALSRGICVHHAGMNRKYRQVVEMLFRRGFLRVVIATGTLALGINMPCATVVFSGDSVFLTALNYRQAAGRAGRRGFDLLGNVVFQGLSQDKVLRLLSSRLPDLNGHFPLTTSLILRLFILLHESGNSPYARKAIDSLLSQPRLYLGGQSFKQQVLHHLRFSIEYLRRQQLLSAGGAPLNFASCVTHLYYTENSAFAFHALLKAGFFHDLCSKIGTDEEQTLRELMIVLSHLFLRRLSRQADQEFIETKVKQSPSIVFLPKLPEAASKILRKHNQETLDVFTAYVSTFVEEHVKEDDRKLPLTGVTVGGQAKAESVPFLKSIPPVRCRSSFVALSGHGDKFDSISDLCKTVRDGVFLEESVIPHVDESSVLLNAYLYDFYRHGQVDALAQANGIRKGEVWFVLNDFSMILSTIITSLTNYLKLSADSDLDMLDDTGGGDAEEMGQDEQMANQADGTVDMMAEAAADFSMQDSGESIIRARIEKKKKAKVVAESWSDEEDVDEEEDSSSSEDSEPEMSGPDGESIPSEGGLLSVLKAFQKLKTEFDSKFKAMWA